MKNKKIDISNIFQNNVILPKNDNHYIWMRANINQINAINKYQKDKLVFIEIFIGIIFLISFCLFGSLFMTEGVSSKYGHHYVKFSESWLELQDMVMPILGIIFVAIFIAIGVIVGLIIHKNSKGLLNKVINGEYLCAYVDNSYSAFYVRIINNGKIVGYKIYK